MKTSFLRITEIDTNRKVLGFAHLSTSAYKIVKSNPEPLCATSPRLYTLSEKSVLALSV